jgi:hypothetical protein
VAGLRIWLDDLVTGECADPLQHLQQIFDSEPLLAAVTAPQNEASQAETAQPAVSAGAPRPDNPADPGGPAGPGWRDLAYSTPCTAIMLKDAAPSRNFRASW